MNKDYGTTPGENQVRCAGQRTSVKLESVSKRVKAGTDGKFRFCILAPDGLHHPTADLGCYDVSQVPAASVLVPGWQSGPQTPHLDL